MARTFTTRFIGVCLWLCLTLPIGAYAQPPALAPLPAVSAASPCEQMLKSDLSTPVGAAVAITSAETRSIEGGLYCVVKGNIYPTIGFEVRLPEKGWTQRYLQVGCGGLCGVVSIHADHDEGCAPANDHALVLATTDMGHQSRGMGDGSFGKDPQKRIDFAYRGVHLTSVAAKALIRAYYGQAPRYSYFSGCSDGGREALVEAERYPGDFNGIAAGAPAMNFQVQNTFYHAWMYDSNRDSSGRAILLADRLPLLHRVVLAECDAQDGLKDGLISAPRSCHPALSEALCAPGQDRSTCLTAAEIAVARKLYDGPSDAAGHRFTIGGPQPGSELAWAGVYVPGKPDQDVMSHGAALDTLKYVAFPTNPAQSYTIGDFKFDEATFARLSDLHPLYDATDTDLSGFQSSGGKLILWHGWSDPHISPINTIAFYQGVQKFLGAEKATSFTRLFLFPGLYHCGGSDGFSQFDILTPLMAWVESGSAPDRIVAGQPAFDGPPMMGPPPPGAPPLGDGPPPGLPPGPPPGLPPGPPKDLPVKAQRPVFAYPLVARYSGSGSPSDARNWSAVAPQSPEPETYEWEGAKFMAPDVLKFFAATKDGLAVEPTP